MTEENDATTIPPPKSEASSSKTETTEVEDTPVVEEITDEEVIYKP